MEQRSRPWYWIWYMALTPSREAYINLLADAPVTLRRAYRWVDWPLALAAMGGMLWMYLSSGSEMTCLIYAAGQGLGIGLILAVLWRVNVGLQNLLARLTGGSGDYAHTAYAMAAHSGPLIWVAALLLSLRLSIPPAAAVLWGVVEVLGLGLWIGSLILGVVALRAVHGLRLGWTIGIVALAAALQAGLALTVGPVALLMWVYLNPI